MGVERLGVPAPAGPILLAVVFVFDIAPKGKDRRDAERNRQEEIRGVVGRQPVLAIDGKGAHTVTVVPGRGVVISAIDSSIFRVAIGEPFVQQPQLEIMSPPWGRLIGDPRAENDTTVVTGRLGIQAVPLPVEDIATAGGHVKAALNITEGGREL